MKKFIVGTLGLVFFAGSFSSIVNLQTVQAASHPVASCTPLLTRHLQKGYTDSATGGEVSKLQGFLNLQGYNPILDLGYFGPLTKNAMIEFQNNYGLLPADGNANPITRSKINELNCNKVVIPPSPSPSPTSTIKSLTLISPNGGEIIPVGSIFPIKWSTNNISSSKSISITIQGETSSGQKINYGFAQVANSGDYNWTVPNRLLSPSNDRETNTHDSLGKYKIQIQGIGSDTSNAHDISDSEFTIVNSTTTPPTMCQKLKEIYLTVGHTDLLTNDDVTKLQEFLIREGYMAPIDDFGYFGLKTKSALIRYQTANNIIPSNGILLLSTRDKINEELCGSMSTPPSSSSTRSSLLSLTPTDRQTQTANIIQAITDIINTNSNYMIASVRETLVNLFEELELLNGVK